MGENLFVVYRNESDRHCFSTLSLNGRAGVQCAPIEELSTAEIRCFAGSPKYVDLVFGGPPCQPFSKSAYWSGGYTLRLKDPHSNTLVEYFRIIEDFKPKAFLLENVHAISYNGKEEGFRILIERIRNINKKAGTDYRPRWTILNAADFGVPQLQLRFFLMALRDGKEFIYPWPTHF
jgi:DNA (cytosine-5)-methyltransferase 1